MVEPVPAHQEVSAVLTIGSVSMPLWVLVGVKFRVDGRLKGSSEVTGGVTGGVTAGGT